MSEPMLAAGLVVDRACAGTRFTVDGDPALEAHLAQVCERVRAGVQRLIPATNLHGILLGGGYGRGEGGVLPGATGDLPYNDLEFYVFVHGSTLLAKHRHGPELRPLGHELEGFAGIEVEFKIVSRRQLQAAPTTMFFHDLFCGHRLVLGDEELLAGCSHHAVGASIPLHEATRLLMNRGSGLLFAAERLQRSVFTAADADFVARNIAKAQLALGDVVLVVQGEYHCSARSRGVRLPVLPPPPGLANHRQIVQMHGAGVAFKLQPALSHESRAVLGERHAAVSRLVRETFLWLESRRLGTAFATPRSYAESACEKCPESPAWRNTLVNLRAQRGAALCQNLCRHPRQRLLHGLALLLWEPAAFTDLQISARLASELLKPVAAVAELGSAVAAYTDLWMRFQ